MRRLDGTVEGVMARLAARRFGLTTRVELLDAEVSDAEIRSRLRSGALLREHPGVYRVGHRAPSAEARYLAAVLAAGKGAVLAGRPAAWWLGLLSGGAPRPEVLASTKRSLRGVLTHRGLPDPRDAFSWRGIPVTSVARTLADVAAPLSEEALARAFHEASVHFGTTPRDVEDVLSRRPTTPGARKLRRVMWGDADVVLSRLERGFLEVLAAEGLPRPRVNRSVDGRWVDCRWPEHHLTVELDSYRYHATRHAWERDRAREREARARGDEWRSFVWGDAFEDREPMLRDLRRLLTSRHAAP